jgi:hypothetical protein
MANLNLDYPPAPSKKSSLALGGVQHMNYLLFRPTSLSVNPGLLTHPLKCSVVI